MNVLQEGLLGYTLFVPSQGDVTVGMIAYDVDRLIPVVNVVAWNGFRFIAGFANTFDGTVRVSFTGRWTLDMTKNFPWGIAVLPD